MKLKKENKIILIFSILLGIGIALMIINNFQNYAPARSMEVEQLKIERNTLKDEIVQLDDIIEERENELNKIKIKYATDNNFYNLENELKKEKVKSGHVDLEGKGIEVIMYDSADLKDIGYNINDYIIHDVDILNIINDLKAAGAEAISINDERVITNSEIKCGGPIIRLNNKSLGAPFMIKAIGEPKVLKAAITAPNTYGHALKNIYKIGIKVKTKDSVLIKKYDNSIDLKYSQPKREGD